MVFAGRADSIASHLGVTLLFAFALAGAPGAASGGQAAEPCPDTGRRAADVDVDVKLRAADADGAAKRWEEAAKGYREVALTSGGSDAGRAAVKGYFKAVNGIVGRGAEPWPAALDTLAKDMPELVRLYCGCKAPADHPEPCLMILLTRRDFTRIHGDSREEEGSKKLEVWARAELALWTDGGAMMCESRLPECEKMAPILSGAAGALEAAGKRIEALRIRKILIDPRYGLDATEEAAKAMRALGGTYEQLGAYDIAATWYEKVAAARPSLGASGGGMGAAESLERAIDLRLKLGDAAGAEADAAIFAKQYGNAPKAGGGWVELPPRCPGCPPPRPEGQPSGLGRIAVRFADTSAERGAWSEARSRLDEVIKRVDQGASPSVKIITHARLGRASAELSDLTRASAEFAKVEAAWRDTAGVIAKIESEGSANDPSVVILAEALNALGEARFFRAERARDQAVQLALPIYKGPDTQAGVLAFINSTVAPWMKKKRERIEAASELYEGVVRIEPEPPPKWVIASASRVGYLWADFVADLRNTPTTPESRRTGPIPGGGGLTYEDLRKAYEGSIDSLTEPLLRRAKEAFQVCVNTSTRSRLFDETSSDCERWLSKAYPGEFHRMDEVFAPPSKLSASVVPRPAVHEE